MAKKISDQKEHQAIALAVKQARLEGSELTLVLRSGKSFKLTVAPEIAQEIEAHRDSAVRFGPKLTDGQRAEIVKELSAGVSINSLAKRFNVSRAAIYWLKNTHGQ